MQAYIEVAQAYKKVRMNIPFYENELRQGMTDAIGKLSRIDGFVLHGFNIWTDPDAGVSEFSADTRQNSDRFVKGVNEWRAKEVEKLLANGRVSLANLMARNIARTNNPADFQYRGIVRIEHANWDLAPAGGEGWEIVEDVLTRLRDEAAATIGRMLSIEPNAEVSIGTRKDWYDRPIAIVK